VMVTPTPAPVTPPVVMMTPVVMVMEAVMVAPAVMTMARRGFGRDERTAAQDENGGSSEQHFAEHGFLQREATPAVHYRGRV
jgi:hypothetical protein